MCHLQQPIVAPSGSKYYCHILLSLAILIEARKAIPVTGVNHTPFTDEHLPTLFFVVTDFISKGEGGEIKQTLSSSPCLHLVLLFDMIFQMPQKHHVQISASSLRQKIPDGDILEEETLLD